MKTLFKTFLMSSLFVSSVVLLSGCDDDDDPQPQLTGNTTSYPLSAVGGGGISGTVTFAERDDAQVLITLQLNGTQSGGVHPAHIHAGSALEGGAIVLDLTAVNGADGRSETVVNALNDGTAIDYEDLLAFDGHVNVHASAEDLSIVAQGDIGGNELLTDSKVYTLMPVTEGATGTATFTKRKNGTTLVTVAVTGTEDGATHPSHIHANTIAEGGGIVIDLNNVDGTTGMARTNVSALNDGTPITYEELLDFNGYLNVHSGSTFVVQGDIGANELLDDSYVYELTPVTPGATGTATFRKRKDATTLVTVEVTGTMDGATHPSHIHANTIAEGGGIVIDLETIDGGTGIAHTSVRQLNDGTPITYEELLDFNGYLNVHSGSTFVVQGDIGANELLDDSYVYELTPVTPGATGTATFRKRKDATTLVTVEVTGTMDGATHPSHIHANTIAEGGGIVIDLETIDGGTGIAHTSVRQLNDGTPITYEELLDFNGYLNVHSGSTFVVQGDIGQNELTGETEEYVLGELGGSGVSGTATFAERKNGKTQVTLALTGTVDGGDHPAHIHANDAATGGGIAVDLENVNGATGMSVTSVGALNDDTPITYAELIDFNGHINVHESAANLGTRIAQGNIGSNAP